VLAKACTIPISVLKATPFSIDWGRSIFARITATNVYGNSVVSPAGNGAIILTVPDAPTNLANNLGITTGS